jgi:hypothetical protein
MVRVWKMFWSMLLTGFTAIDDAVATVGVATRVARQEADGTALILDIDREARIAQRTAAARALVAELSAPAENANAK